MSKILYKNPKGQPLISTISSGCSTPILAVRYCNLLHPYRYPNSPTIPRYSITCILDPEIEPDFLNGLQSIEKNEKVESMIKLEYKKEGSEYFTTGNLIIKFQGKDKVPIYLADDDHIEEIELEDELAVGEKVKVFYDILRYTKKSSMNFDHALNFKPIMVYYYPKKN